MACTLPLVLPVFRGSLSASSDDSRRNSALSRTVCSITLAKRGWPWLRRPTKAPSPATAPTASPAAKGAGNQCIVAHRSIGFTTKGLSRSFTQASPKRRASRRLSNASSHSVQQTPQASSSGGSGAGACDLCMWQAAPQIGATGSDGLVVVSSVGSDSHNSTFKPYSFAPRAPAAQRKQQQKPQQQQPDMGSHSSSAGAAQVVSDCPAKIPFAAAPNSTRSAANYKASSRSPTAAATSSSAAAAGAVTTSSATASIATTAVARGSKQQPTQKALQRIRSAGGCILRGLRGFGASVCFDLSLNAPDAGTWAAARQSFCAAGPLQLGRRYRAKFITGTVQALKSKPAGGAAWLMSLRHVPFSEAVEALCTLPGVGPKVAACICLFSLDKHDAIPVDTHVWQLATRYYAPQLAGKTLTPKLHGVVQEVFVERFGPYAGWAHNTLFISELASHRGLLPEQLRSPLRGERRKSTGTGTGGGSTGKRRSSSTGAGSDAADAEAAEAAATPGRAGAGGSAGRRRSSSSTGAGAASATAGGSGATGTGKRRRSSSIALGGPGGGAAAQAAMLAAAGGAPAGAGAGGVKGELGVEEVAGTVESGSGAQVPALRRGGRARQASKRLADGDGEAGSGADEGRPSRRTSLEEVKEEEEVSPPGSTKRRRKKGVDGDD